jgi:hypothetical protein
VLYVAPNNVVTMSNLTIDGARASVGGLSCFTQNLGWTYTDVLFGPLATGYITNIAVNNSPATGIWLSGGPTSQPSWIQLSTISHARATGLYMNGPVKAVSNNFYYNGTAAINVKDSQGQVYWNNLSTNRYENPDGSGGGQLFFDQNSSYITVAENYIDGGNWSTTPGQFIYLCTAWSQDVQPK